MVATKRTPQKSGKKGEIGRVNNEKDPGRKVPPSEREVGITNNESPRTGKPADREIGITKNQNPSERKPVEPEIGVVHNDVEDKKRAEKKKNK